MSDAKVRIKFEIRIFWGEKFQIQTDLNLFFPKRHTLHIHKKERIQAALAAQFPILSLFSFAVLIIFVNFASVT